MKKFLQKIYKIKIFKRLVPSVLKLYIKIFKKNFLIIKHNDIYLKLNLLNPIDREIYLKGQYEKEKRKLFPVLHHLHLFFDICHQSAKPFAFPN